MIDVDKLKELLPLFGIIWGILIYIRIRNHLDKSNKVLKIEKEKKCPPHTWKWEEQIGMQGTWYIRCQSCRKLPGWSEEI